jgi:hypothetical protein
VRWGMQLPAAGPAQQRSTGAAEAWSASSCSGWRPPLLMVVVVWLRAWRFREVCRTGEGAWG